jgi:hypothetical protein
LNIEKCNDIYFLSGQIIGHGQRFARWRCLPVWGVIKKELDPGAEGVRANLTIRVPDQRILEAFVPAERQVGALEAVIGQVVPLGHVIGLLAGGEV